MDPFNSAPNCNNAHLVAKMLGTSYDTVKEVEIFDTTLNKPVWSNAAGGWTDATGTLV